MLDICSVFLARATARLAFAQNFRQSSRKSVRMLSLFLAGCVPSIHCGPCLSSDFVIMTPVFSCVADPHNWEESRIRLGPFLESYTVGPFV